MSQNTDLTYYQKNRDVILNRAKFFLIFFLSKFMLFPLILIHYEE